MCLTPSGHGCGSVVVDSLFSVALIVCGGFCVISIMLGPGFVILYFVSFWFCNHIDGEDRAGCFTLIVFLMFCDSQCSVAIPNGTMGWSAVCDCGTS